MAVTTMERNLARAQVYRFLSLVFAYPTAALHAEILGASIPTKVAASLISEEVAFKVAALTRDLDRRERRELASEYRSLFTYSASPDCPLSESAYSAKHIYQEVQDLADIGGFYTAFGIEVQGDRPDSLSAELEFCYLLALKEALAREQKLAKEALTCREARRLFVHDHLGRWAENIGRRVEALAPDTVFAAAGRLLAAFVEDEIRTLRVQGLVPYQEVPNPPEPIDDEGCPAEQGLGTTASRLVAEDPAPAFVEVTPGGGR